MLLSIYGQLLHPQAKRYPRRVRVNRTRSLIPRLGNRFARGIYSTIGMQIPGNPRVLPEPNPVKKACAEGATMHAATAKFTEAHSSVLASLVLLLRSTKFRRAQLTCI